MSAGPRIDLVVKPGAVSWRMWSGSRIVAASSERYVKQSAAVRNLETVTGGVFEKVGTPDVPAPYGILTRRRDVRDDAYDRWESIPVRLVES